MPLVTSENPAEVERLLGSLFDYAPLREAA
jgi:hypothetical protein